MQAGGEWVASLMAYSHCTGTGLGQVYELDLHNRKQWVLVPFTLSDQWEHF